MISNSNNLNSIKVANLLLVFALSLSLSLYIACTDTSKGCNPPIETEKLLELYNQVQHGMSLLEVEKILGSTHDQYLNKKILRCNWCYGKVGASNYKTITIRLTNDQVYNKEKYNF